MEFPVDTFLKRRIRGLGGGGPVKSRSLRAVGGIPLRGFLRGVPIPVTNDMSLGFEVWGLGCFRI